MDNCQRYVIHPTLSIYSTYYHKVRLYFTIHRLLLHTSKRSLLLFLSLIWLHHNPYISFTAEWFLDVCDIARPHVLDLTSPSLYSPVQCTFPSRLRGFHTRGLVKDRPQHLSWMKIGEVRSSWRAWRMFFKVRNKVKLFCIFFDNVTKYYWMKITMWEPYLWSIHEVWKWSNGQYRTLRVVDPWEM